VNVLARAQKESKKVIGRGVAGQSFNRTNPETSSNTISGDLQNRAAKIRTNHNGSERDNLPGFSYRGRSCLAGVLVQSEQIEIAVGIKQLR